MRYCWEACNKYGVYSNIHARIRSIESILVLIIYMKHNIHTHLHVCLFNHLYIYAWLYNEYRCINKKIMLCMIFDTWCCKEYVHSSNIDIQVRSIYLFFNAFNSHTIQHNTYVCKNNCGSHGKSCEICTSVQYREQLYN